MSDISRDYYTDIHEERERLLKDVEALQGRLKEVNDTWHQMRDGVVMAQGEQCAYCAVYLRSARAYELYCNLPDPSEIENPSAADSVPYEAKEKYQIRIKRFAPSGADAPEQRLSNLVACCVDCGQRKAYHSHDPFLAWTQEVNWPAIVEAKRERQRTIAVSIKARKAKKSIEAEGEK